jgi:hypothetical protein
MSNWTKEYAGFYVSKTYYFEILKDCSYPDMWELRQFGRCIGQFDTLAEAKRASGLR